METAKTCTGCTIEQPVENFYLTKGKPQARCKRCVLDYQRHYYKSKGGRDPLVARNNRLKREYGIDVAEFDRVAATQGGRCLTCHIVPDEVLHVDHCHKTGRVRGLLCNNCNRALGMVKDDPAIARALADYLESQSNGQD